MVPVMGVEPPPLQAWPWQSRPEHAVVPDAVPVPTPVPLPVSPVMKTPLEPPSPVPLAAPAPLPPVPPAWPNTVPVWAPQAADHTTRMLHTEATEVRALWGSFMHPSFQHHAS